MFVFLQVVQGMSEEMQAMCFMAGANSIFYGDKLLVTGNPERRWRSAFLWQELDQKIKII